MLNAEPPATTTATTEEPGTVLDVYRLHEGTKDALRYLKNTNFATLPGVYVLPSFVVLFVDFWLGWATFHGCVSPS